MKPSEQKTAIVIGATGIIGRAITAMLAADKQWQVVALSRSGVSIPGVHKVLTVDLIDQHKSRQELAAFSKVTHLFYAAYLPFHSFAEEIAPNRQMLINAIEGLEAAGAKLQHVVLVTGAKYYGLHFGAVPAPINEETQPNLGPIFNRVQETYLRSRTDACWQWTNLVPTHLTGFAIGKPMNLALSIGTYATIVRELGFPLYFPGSKAAFEAMTQIADADQIAKAAIWAVTTESASGQTFNIANGDPTRWSLLWPEIASYFGMQPGQPRQFPLAEAMLEQADLWRRLAEKHQLKQAKLAQLVNWKFLEFMFTIEFDVVLALGKIRRAGFTQHPDTISEFKKRFDEYVREGILPKP